MREDPVLCHHGVLSEDLVLSDSCYWPGHNTNCNAPIPRCAQFGQDFRCMSYEKLSPGGLGVKFNSNDDKCDTGQTSQMHRQNWVFAKDIVMTQRKWHLTHR